MKKIIFFLGLFISGLGLQAQNGLESIIVEKYYVSNAADASGSVGTLPAGSVTYRFYVDMLPGYKFQAAYGSPVGSHVLTFSTTTSFFNNEDRGAVTPTFTKTQARSNTVILDSYISAGAAASGNFGVLKSEDDVASGGATVVNNSVPPILQNADPSAGIPLTTHDGLWTGSPSAVTTVGQTDAQAGAVFDATSQAGGVFTLTDGAWSSLAGAQGPTASNRVLIAQITTDGVLTYALNIQIGTPTGGVERYVHTGATGSEIDIPSLSGTLGAPNTLPTVSITSPADGTGFITGSTINIAATAADADGSVASVAFFVDGVLLSTDNTAPYTASYVGSVGTDVLTAVATDDQGGTKTSTAVTINIASNPPPSVSITSPTSGASFITGDAVNISATASDNGSVTQVEFFVNGTLLSTDNSAPYTAVYTAALGNHTLTARATDNAGLQTTSTPVSISVLNNVPPTVNLTSPTAGALFTAPAVVTFAASANDPDGTITQVEFLVNGTVVNTDNAAPYTFNWTSVVGNASIVARATDNRGAATSTAPLVLEIADPNALPYKVQSAVATCNGTSFCLPVRAVNTVSNVIGYDLVLTYDAAKVTPTGVITVAGDLITPSFVSTDNTINAAAGTIAISVFFNSNAPASARFSGTGELLCVEFNKTAGFGSADQTSFSISSLQESYFTGVTAKLAQAGTYTTFKDSTFNSKLNFWLDSSPIRYNPANPNEYLATNIRGTDASCANPSAAAVQPNLQGAFSYNVNNGVNINIDKNILSTTDVQAVINGFDAVLTRRLLSNDVALVPSVYQVVAMDVNLDGVVSSGDVSQINQRAVLSIPEFKQAWNYNIAGVSNGQPSKDWLFIDSNRVVTSAAYVISSTFPLNDGVGFSKARVPQVPFCLPVAVSDFAVCPAYSVESYKGVLIGDVNGNYATASPNNAFRLDERYKVVFNLGNAMVSNNTVTIPVTAVSPEAINAVDFALSFNEQKLSFNSVSNIAEGLDAMHHFNADDRKLRFTSNSLSAIDNNNPVAYVKFNVISGNISNADFMSAVSYLDGELAGVAFTGELPTAINDANIADAISVFPNPARQFVQVVSPETVNVQVMDINGRVVAPSVRVMAGQTHKIETSDLASGVYFLHITNDNFTAMKKVIVNK
jgi:hypothetical protein